MKITLVMASSWWGSGLLSLPKKSTTRTAVPQGTWLVKGDELPVTPGVEADATRGDTRLQHHFSVAPGPQPKNHLGFLQYADSWAPHRPTQSGPLRKLSGNQYHLPLVILMHTNVGDSLITGKLLKLKRAHTILGSSEMQILLQ